MKTLFTFSILLSVILTSNFASASCFDNAKLNIFAKPCSNENCVSEDTKVGEAIITGESPNYQITINLSNTLTVRDRNNSFYSFESGEYDLTEYGTYWEGGYPVELTDRAHNKLVMRGGDSTINCNDQYIKLYAPIVGDRILTFAK